MWCMDVQNPVMWFIYTLLNQQYNGDYVLWLFSLSQCMYDIKRPHSQLQLKAFNHKYTLSFIGIHVFFKSTHSWSEHTLPTAFQCWFANVIYFCTFKQDVLYSPQWSSITSSTSFYGKWKSPWPSAKWSPPFTRVVSAQMSWHDLQSL